jgi:hypothetical protein
MDSERLNRWLTLGANLGVLVGIILLIVELDQNREMMKSQTRNELSNNIVILLSEAAGNTELASIMHRAFTGDELTPVQALQFLHRQYAMFRYWENVHYQYRMGLYDDSEYAAHFEGWRSYINYAKAIADEWCSFRGVANEEFVSDIDSLMTEYSC